MSATFDREAAREVLDTWYGTKDADIEYDWAELLDALAGCVRPVPPQTIDRVRGLLKRHLVFDDRDNPMVSWERLNKVLALVVPDSRFDTMLAKDDV